MPPDTEAMPPSAGTAIETLRGLGVPPPAAPDYTDEIEGHIKRYGEAGTARTEALQPMREAQAETALTGARNLRTKLDAIEPVDIKPWTEKPPEWNPVEQFGSLASVFAQIAAQFTSMPARNALNGAAAAMRAARSNDVYRYQQGFEAWKSNSRFALERHDSMMKDYDAASSLLRTDLAAGSAAMEALGAKYGDQMTIELAQAGMYDKLNQMWQTRDQSARGWAQLMPQIEKHAQSQEILMADPDWKSDDPALKSAAYERMLKATNPTLVRGLAPRGGVGAMDAAQREELINQRIAELEEERGGPLSAEEKLAVRNLYTQKAGTAKALTPEQDAQKKAYDRGLQEFRDTHDGAEPDLDEEMAIRQKAFLTARDVKISADKAATQERLKKRDQMIADHQANLLAIKEGQFETTELRRQAELAERQRHHEETEKVAANKLPTMGQIDAQAARAEIADLEAKQNAPVTGAQMTQIVQRIKSAPMSGNRADDLRSKIDLFDNSVKKIDDSLNILENYVGAAGIAGRANRLTERVGNILGTDSTDRVQFMRDITYLQALAPRLLLDVNARPLSGEASRINDIVAGLSIGDTTANTIRSLQELRDLYAEMQGDVRTRLGAGNNATGASAASPRQPGDTSGTEPPPANESRRPAWMSAPAVGR